MPVLNDHRTVLVDILRRVHRHYIGVNNDEIGGLRGGKTYGMEGGEQQPD